ncbi:DEVIL-like protein [Parasponia andersonii]|uniref:DEVIL-like protein n=1 Tax=Parasponia andersonii TaxID=3476 RepID=A0A2P5BAJ9_PARAD|nr:DEVIL-like protein [Parasponia andersonii]
MASSSNNGACSVSGSGSVSVSGSGAPQPSFYLNEKWKFSKKESLSRSCRSSSSCPLVKNSQRRCSFARKCARLVKEQRARFYIMRRCVTMLICWRDYSDS